MSETDNALPADLEAPRVTRHQEQSEEGAGAPGVQLQLEVLSDAAARRILHCVTASIFAATISMVLIASFATAGHVETIKDIRPILYTNAALACVEVLALAVGLLVLFYRIWLAMRGGLGWTRRRRRTTALAAVEALVIFLSVVFYLIPNVHAVSKECAYFDAIVFWSLFFRFLGWQTIFASFVVRVKMSNLWVDKNGRPVDREDGMILDAPLYHHIPVFIFWVAFLGFNMSRFGEDVKILSESGVDLTVLCTEDAKNCKLPGYQDKLFSSLNWMYWGFLGFFVIYAGRGVKQLYRKSYISFRWVCAFFRYQCQTIGTVFTFMLISLTVTSSAGGGCANYATAWFGSLPCQLLATVLAVVNIILFMPNIQTEVSAKALLMRRTEHHLLVWCESEGFKKRPHKEQVLPTGDGVAFWDSGPDEQDPVFCFETAIKLYYWSILPYRYDPETGQNELPFQKDIAVGLYRIGHLEHFYGESMDMRCFIGWTGDLVLVTFRGTKTTKNLLADANTFRVCHPPERGSLWLRNRPMVHAGFLQSWTGDNMNDRVLKRVKEIIDSPEFDGSNMRVLVTGHSLGGAVAVLAAFDMQKLLGLPRDRLVVYTYGAPRVGNSAFATEFNATVPNCWLVMNNMDRIVNLPNFWTLYKHVNNKVHINPDGRLIIKPMMSESRLLSMGRTRSIADHQLPSYKRSFVAIVKSQFVKNRGLPGGDVGVMQLFDHCNLSEVLEMSKGELAAIDRLGSSIWAKQREAKRRKRQERLSRLLVPLRCAIDRWCRCGRRRDNEAENQPVGCMGTNYGCCWGKGRLHGSESAEWYTSATKSVNGGHEYPDGKGIRELRRS